MRLIKLWRNLKNKSIEEQLNFLDEYQTIESDKPLGINLALYLSCNIVSLIIAKNYLPWAYGLLIMSTFMYVYITFKYFKKINYFYDKWGIRK